MFVSSLRFAQSVVRSHDVVTQCDIVDKTGQLVVADLNVIGGNVSVDANRKVRRQCSLTIEDPNGDVVPDEFKDLLRPYSGYSLRIARGIGWRDGTREMFPLGTFSPYNPRITDKGDSLSIAIEGYDKSKIISRTRWTQPYAIPSGANTGVAIRNLLETRMPGLRYNFEPTKATVPGSTLGTAADNDPWDDAVNIANADGMELFFDARDVVTMRKIPDPTIGTPVSVFEDNASCTVTQFRQEIDASKMYTGVIVYSEGSEVNKPIRVEVWREDTDLRIPYFFPTALIQTEAQAIATGRSLLNRVGRAERSVELTAVPDPRREEGDIVRVKRERSKLDDVFVVSAVNMPLDSTSEMSLTTESRRTAT